MGKCSDCWCEHYDKSRGNCDQCIKKEGENEKMDLGVIFKREAVKQMGLGKKNKMIGQER